jgi:aminopeptidase N
VYQKGGWSLHMLRGEIGDQKFWAAIREYYKRYRDANATTADFERTVEEVSGEDLRWFFQQWLYRAGSPAVTATWRYDATAKKVMLDLTQTESGAPYRLPLQVALATSGTAAPKVEKVSFTEKQQHFEIPSDQEPTSLEIDPNVWLLIDAKVAKSN